MQNKFIIIISALVATVVFFVAWGMWYVMSYRQVPTSQTAVAPGPVQPAPISEPFYLDPETGLPSDEYVEGRARLMRQIQARRAQEQFSRGRDEGTYVPRDRGEPGLGL